MNVNHEFGGGLSVYSQFVSGKRVNLKKKAPLVFTKKTASQPAVKKKTSRRIVKKKTVVPVKPKAPAQKVEPKPKIKKVSNPGSFNTKKPTAPGKFVFNKKEPVKKEVLVPSAPPHPGEAPSFDYEKQVNVKKLEYVYGIRNLEINYKQYQDSSVFVSTPFQIKENAIEVGLETVEDHPIFDGLSGEAAERQTSIEYYVTYKKEPHLNDWLPILPKEEKKVQSEKLFFSEGRTAMVRFPILFSEDVFVYENNIKLSQDDFTLLDGGRRVQLLSSFNSQHIYTIDYTPNQKIYDPWSINIEKEGFTVKEITEVFEEGTDINKKITLSQVPYIDYGRINDKENYDPNTSDYQPIRVEITEAHIAGPNRATYRHVPNYESDEQPVFTYNRTDYIKGKEEDLKLYRFDGENDYNGFDYKQKDNHLIFTETFKPTNLYENEKVNHGYGKIKVTYSYIESDVRMKAIMRRNSGAAATLTPTLSSYKLKFKLMK